MLVLVLMLMLMLVSLDSRDHCIKPYLDDGRSTLSTFAADPDDDEKSCSPQLKTAGGGRTFVIKSSLLPITFDALVTGMAPTGVLTAGTADLH